MNKPLIIAHRGGDGPYEENTLEGLRHAVSHGCTALEIDVRFDHLKKRFYLEHDFIHSPRKNRENVMAKVVSALPGKTFFVVELKTLAWLRTYYARSFLKEFSKLFKPENAVIISFNPFVMTQIRRLAPELKRGYLMGNFYWRLLFRTIFHRCIRPDYLLINKRIFNMRYVKFARKRGYKLFCFVLNSRASWQKALDFGIDGIITDRPVELNAFLREKGYNQA
jgi:glycerophosphoryl diester phosphodiesterase